MQTDYGRLRFTSSVITPAPGDGYLLQVGVSLDRDGRARSPRSGACCCGACRSACSSVVGGSMDGRPCARAAGALADGTRTIDVANLQQRLPVRGAGDELDEVAHAFNDMLAGWSRRSARCASSAPRWLTSCARRWRRCAARSSWRCDSPGRPRTAPPLTSQLEEFDKLTRLIDQLLTLARAEAGESRSRANASIWRRWSAPSSNSSSRSRTRGPPAVEAIDARPDRRRRRLARTAAAEPARQRDQVHPGGRLSVRLSAREVRPRSRSTTPAGMSPAVLPHLFERFYRADPARSRAGAASGWG